MERTNLSLQQELETSLEMLQNISMKLSTAKSKASDMLLQAQLSIMETFLQDHVRILHWRVCQNPPSSQSLREKESHQLQPFPITRPPMQLPPDSLRFGQE